MQASARETAEDGIAAALEPLQPDEAMAALVEIQAMILAKSGILPRTPEFELFATSYLALLSERVHDMRRAMIAGCNPVRH